MALQSKVSDILQLMPSCICAIIFIFFILLDVWKAYRRRTHSIPGEALALTAFTLQLLAFINYSTINFLDDRNQRQQEEDTLLRQDQLVIDSGRAVFCVLIGYLLPGMARTYGWNSVWGDIGAFSIGLLANMATELYFIWNLRKVNNEAELQDYPTESLWFIVSSMTISATIILLTLVLGCAVLAGKSILAMNSRKIRLALSCCSNSSQECENTEDHVLKCENTEDHVLKCWIVVRVTQPEYIIARSVLSSIAGLVITVCNVILALKWKYIALVLSQHESIWHKIMVLIHVAFVLIGWIVVFFRWVTAVMFFPIQNPLFHMEDFWTRNLLEVKEDLDGHLTGRLFWKTRNHERTLLETITVNLITALRLHSLLLTMLIMLQKIVISLSKGCWCLSYIVFRIFWWCLSKIVFKIIWWCLPKIVFRIIPPFIMQSFREWKNMLFNSRPEYRKRMEISNYRKALEIVRMPGENCHSLWKANQWAFKKTVKHMIEGSEFVELGCGELQTLIRESKQCVKDVAAPPKIEEITETKESAEVGIEKHFKMRAVSLIHLMIDCYTGSKSGAIQLDEVNNAIQTYLQAWDIMGMVDISDPEAKMVSLAADKEFDALEKIWKRHLQTKYIENANREGKPLKELLASLEQDLGQIESQKLLERLKEKGQIDMEANRKAMDNHSDCKDWTDSQDCMEIASQISLSRTWEIMKGIMNPPNANTICELRRVLSKFIVHCIKEVEKELIKNCNKWAEDGSEQEIYDAAFLAGKIASIKKLMAPNKVDEGSHSIQHEVAAAGRGNDEQDEALSR